MARAEVGIDRGKAGTKRVAVVWRLSLRILWANNVLPLDYKRLIQQTLGAALCIGAAKTATLRT